MADDDVNEIQSEEPTCTGEDYEFTEYVQERVIWSEQMSAALDLERLKKEHPELKGISW